jgi:hypothetical protein
MRAASILANLVFNIYNVGGARGGVQGSTVNDFLTLVTYRRCSQKRRLSKVSLTKHSFTPNTLSTTTYTTYINILNKLKCSQFAIYCVASSMH